LRQVKAASVVDKLISFWVDLCTPGRGAGESTWWMQGIRTVSQSTERTSREMDIRNTLRRWDRDHPQIHHELIIRYLCGAIISVGCTSLYNAMRRSINNANSHDRYYRR
jgi:hypothetical protein